ncbi:MAG: hypothetical protein ACFBSE_26190 [Prochloraceae cyanobacterium]
MTVLPQFKNKATSLIYLAKYPKYSQNSKTYLDNLSLEIYENFLKKHPELAQLNNSENKAIAIKKLKLSVNTFLNESEKSLASFFDLECQSKTTINK